MQRPQHDKEKYRGRLLCEAEGTPRTECAVFAGMVLHRLTPAAISALRLSPPIADVRTRAQARLRSRASLIFSSPCSDA